MMNADTGASSKVKVITGFDSLISIFLEKLRLAHFLRMNLTYRVNMLGELIGMNERLDLPD